MLVDNSVLLNYENNDYDKSRKIGIYEKFIYDHPVVLKFDYSLFKKSEFIIKGENDQPLFKFNKKNYGKITDMDDNVIYNFRLEVKGVLNDDIVLHTYLNDDIFNTKKIEITQFDTSNNYQLIFTNPENEKIKLVVNSENRKNLSVSYYKNFNKIEICRNSHENGENIVKIESGVDILFIFSIVFSVLQLNEAHSLGFSAPFK